MSDRSTQREVAISAIKEARDPHGRISNDTWVSIVNAAWEYRHSIGGGRGAAQDVLANLLDTIARENLDGDGEA